MSAFDKICHEHAQYPTVNEQLRQFVTQAPLAIAMFDREMRYIVASRQWLIDFGLGEQDLCGRSHHELFPDQPVRWEMLYRRGLDGHFVQQEDCFERGDGTQQWLRWQIQPWYSDGTQGGVSVFAENITEQKQVDQLFRTAVEASLIGMLITNRHGTILLANSTAEQMFGYDPGTLMGEAIEVLVPPRFRAQHPSERRHFAAAATSRPMGAGRELYGVRKDGIEFPVEIGLSPANMESDQSVLCTIIDITLRKQQADQLRKINDELTRNNLQLSRFAYIASHDLRTPLRSICGFSQQLQEEYAGQLHPEALDWIARIVQSSMHLDTLIRDLVTYSRITSQEVPLEQVALRDVFDEVVLLIDATIKEADARVTCGELPVVAGVRSQLQQLLMNLIGNALKYRGKTQPHVHVSAELVGTEWIVSVRDNGVGIDPKHHQKIFEIFQRLHRANEYPGTGIGLAICRQIVEQHRGRIWVESQANLGSTFKFSLPALMANNK